MGNFTPLRLSDGTIIDINKKTIILPGTGEIFGGEDWTDSVKLAELATAGLECKAYIDHKPAGGRWHDVAQGAPVESNDTYTETYSLLPKPKWANDLPALRDDVIGIVKYRARNFLAQYSDLRWQVERAIVTMHDPEPIPVSDEAKQFRSQVLTVVSEYEDAVNAATTFEDILALPMPLEQNPAELDKVRMVKA
jgi:hypothetical protein